MQLHLMTEPQQGATYDQLLDVARAAEELGFAGFFRSDHYQRSGAGDPGPGPTEAWVTLAGLARETTRMRLGSLVSPATFRPPGPFAITVATVDAMSNGRVELGFGLGWNATEHAAHGLPFPEPRERLALFAEQLEIIVGIWLTPVGQKFSHRGRYYTLIDCPALPKPVQAPRPPIILGGSGKRGTARLAGRFADEYNVAFHSVEASRQVIDGVRAEAGDRRLGYSVAQALCVGRSDVEVDQRIATQGRRSDDQGLLIGTPAQVVDRIGEFAAIGVGRVYLQITDLADRAQLELVANEVLPQI